MRGTLATTLIDVPLILLTLAVALWSIPRTDVEVEVAIGLPSSAWLSNMDVFHQKRLDEIAIQQTGHIRLSNREQYARKYPGSPVTWINRPPLVLAGEQVLNKCAERSLPALIVASLTLGIVAVRRVDRPDRRRRWRPGRVAAAAGLMVVAMLAANDYLVRTPYFRLGQRGDYHDDSLSSWLTIARVIGGAILAAWLTMAVSGRWRLSRGWRERLGVGLGVVWLLMFAWLVVLEPIAQLD